MSAGLETATVDRLSVVIVPPGIYTLIASRPSRISRVLVASDAGELAATATNAELYQAHPAGTATLVSWPEPTDGYRLRTYAVDDYELRAYVLGRAYRAVLVGRDLRGRVGFHRRGQPRAQACRVVVKDGALVGVGEKG